MLTPGAFTTFLASLQVQRLIDLSTLKGGNETNLIFKGNTSIYASATTVDITLAKLIILNSKESGEISLLDLTKRRKTGNSDLMDPWLANGVTTLTTNLTTKQLKALNGFIYCTSEKQAKDPRFNVYDVSQNQTAQIDLSSSGNGNATTIVFLNSNALPSHPHSTAISKWNQTANTSVQIYRDIPTDDVEADSSQLFWNPMIVGNKPIFFKTVNDFSVTLGEFYMKIGGKGSIVFNTSPTYFDINSMQTGSISSTGFYMKSASEAERAVTFHIPLEPGFTGFGGVWCIANTPKDSDVVVSMQTSNGSYGTAFSPSEQSTRWGTSMLGKNFSISSKDVGSGQFFIQYFTIKLGNTEVPPTPAAVPVPAMPDLSAILGNQNGTLPNPGLLASLLNSTAIGQPGVIPSMPPLPSLFGTSIPTLANIPTLPPLLPITIPTVIEATTKSSERGFSNFFFLIMILMISVGSVKFY